MLLATCVNTTIDHNVFHNLRAHVARWSASCVNGPLAKPFVLGKSNLNPIPERVDNQSQAPNTGSWFPVACGFGVHPDPVSVAQTSPQGLWPSIGLFSEKAVLQKLQDHLYVQSQIKENRIIDRIEWAVFVLFLCLCLSLGRTTESLNARPWILMQDSVGNLRRILNELFPIGEIAPMPSVLKKLDGCVSRQ